jgi:transaldolase
MAIFPDSATIDDARSAAAYGFVFGATTNPTLLVRAGHTDFRAALSKLGGILPGPVFYQLVAHALPEMSAEHQDFRRAGPKLAFKIPARCWACSSRPRCRARVWWL